LTLSVTLIPTMVASTSDGSMGHLEFTPLVALINFHFLAAHDKTL